MQSEIARDSYRISLLSYFEKIAQQRVQTFEDTNSIFQIILWNNKFIFIDEKSVDYKTLAEKGILRIGDLISENNELITKRNLRDLNVTPLKAFRFVSTINALPNE